MTKTKLIDASEGITDVMLGQSWKGDFYVSVSRGFWKTKRYFPKDIRAITEIDEEQYRSAGGAAAWAIAGGVLTGGIGLLAGAAIGGRRRRVGTYLIVFEDGAFIAIEERRKQFVKKLNVLVAKKAMVENGGSPKPSKGLPSDSED